MVFGTFRIYGYRLCFAVRGFRKRCSMARFRDSFAACFRVLFPSSLIEGSCALSLQWCFRVSASAMLSTSFSSSAFLASCRRPRSFWQALLRSAYARRFSSLYFDSRTSLLRCSSLYFDSRMSLLLCRPLFLDSRMSLLRCSSLYLDSRKSLLRCRFLYFDSRMSLAALSLFFFIFCSR